MNTGRADLTFKQGLLRNHIIILGGNLIKQYSKVSKNNWLCVCREKPPN